MTHQIIAKKDKKTVYSWLFQEGVICCKKTTVGNHNVLKNIKNLHVRMLLRSLTSRKLVAETFSWQWHYWTLTKEGITHLRQYLHIPDNVQPRTLQKQKREAAAPGFAGKDGDKGGFKKGGYRQRSGRPGRGRRQGPGPRRTYNGNDAQKQD